MEPMLIAHLSDLHFGEKEDPAVWEALVGFINDELKPHLVLITGDIVNTPDAALFERAKQQIDRLRPRAKADARYRVCAGNHDRFAHGNSAGEAPRWLRWLAGGTKGSNLTRSRSVQLENVFQGGLVLTPDLPFEVQLPDATAAKETSGNAWKIRVLGCDSSEAETYFAQGMLGVRSIDQLRNAALDENDADLVIVLVHHHLMPIASLEREQPDARSLANVTGMLNSGTALNMLAASHVNLVLHGHEHHAQASCFRTYDGGRGEVAIVSAASSTGTETLAGWAIKRARFNVIELRADRSVHLQEVHGEKGYFALSDRPAIKLLDAEDVRRARFLRKAAKKSAGATRDLPRSVLTKMVELQHDRDALITDTRTDLLLGEQWTIPTRNRTGTPTTASAECVLADGQLLRLQADWTRTGDGDNGYVARFVDERIAGRQLDRLTTSWAWEGGSVLTTDELGTLADPGEFRKDGKDFVSVKAPESDLKELTLVIRLPPEFAPDQRAIEAWTMDEGAAWKKNLGLGQLVQSLGPGLFTLRIPYPLPLWRYAVCWPIAEFCARPEALIAHLRANAIAVHARLCDELDARSVPPDATVALYLREGLANRLHRVAVRSEAPTALELHEASGLVRSAWWGRLRASAPEANDGAGLFCPGDTYVMWMPVRQPGDPTLPAAGLVRVALRSLFTDVAASDAEQVRRLRDALVNSSSAW